MARPFSNSDAKRLIKEHTEMFYKLNSAKESDERYRAKVNIAADELVAQEVFNILRDTH